MPRLLLECRQLTKKYGPKTVLDGIVLSLQAGEIMSLVGPSGAGKTTLLRCIAGLEPLTGGSLLLEGRDITRLRVEKRSIVMMFQQPLLFPHLTVFDNIVYGLRAKRTGKEELKAIGAAMLARIEMEDRGGSYPFELSGGQQQRVALARALVLKPRLILLDEPFANLDPELRGSLRAWVHRVIKTEKITALFVTHDKEEAMIMGDRIAVLRNGRIEQAGTPFEVYTKPANPAVAEFFSDGLVVENRGFLAGSGIKVEKRSGKRQLPDHGCCPGVVREKWIRAGQFMYRIEVPGQRSDLVIPSPEEFEPDEPVLLMYSEQDMHYFPRSSP